MLSFVSIESISVEKLMAKNGPNTLGHIDGEAGLAHVEIIHLLLSFRDVLASGIDVGY